MNNELKILATTYAVNPFKGSEDGMGWNFIYQIARFNFVTAVTRENNREAIEKFMIENPDPVYQRIRFLYFDLPYWMRFWKRVEEERCCIIGCGNAACLHLLKNNPLILISYTM